MTAWWERESEEESPFDGCRGATVAGDGEPRTGRGFTAGVDEQARGIGGGEQAGDYGGDGEEAQA